MNTRKEKNPILETGTAVEGKLGNNLHFSQNTISIEIGVKKMVNANGEVKFKFNVEDYLKPFLNSCKEELAAQLKNEKADMECRIYLEIPNSYLVASLRDIAEKEENRSEMAMLLNGKISTQDKNDSSTLQQELQKTDFHDGLLLNFYGLKKSDKDHDAIEISDIAKFRYRSKQFFKLNELSAYMAVTDNENTFFRKIHQTLLNFPFYHIQKALKKVIATEEDKNEYERILKEGSPEAKKFLRQLANDELIFKHEYAEYEKSYESESVKFKIAKKGKIVEFERMRNHLFSNTSTNPSAYQWENLLAFKPRW